VWVSVCVRARLSGRRDYVMECAGGREESRPVSIVVKCMSWNNKEEIETTCTVQQ
jgi:hypothetical protein